MTTPDFQRDLMAEIFGERPELAFRGYLGQAGLAQSQERFLSGKASEFLGRLQQAVGQQMIQGGLPTLTPEGFFGGMDWQNELYKYGRGERGMRTSQFAPRTQFLFGGR